MRILVTAVATVTAVLAASLQYRPRRPGQPKFAVPKLIAGALSGYLVPAGALAASLSVLSRMPISFALGAAGAAVSALYLREVTAPHKRFAEAFGTSWQQAIRPDVASRMLSRRWSWWLHSSPPPRWHRNVAYWTLPESGLRLLCDIWQPPEDIPPSGLGFVYLHGGYWHYFDKDSGTRPLFRHLAAQGHVVMDVSYRLCPEVDLTGMMEDVTRAIAWIKRCGEEYGVSPDRIVVGGGSAGAHLAMLAAYAPGNPKWTPGDLKSMDLSVRGLISYYGPPDLRPVNAGPDANLEEGPIHFHTARVEAERGLAGRFELLRRVRARLARRSHEEMMINLLGGLYREVPDMYALASPITHVHPGCPPTLMFQGAHDSLVSVESARVLRQRLHEEHVPVVYLEYPDTEHAFDLVLPQVSPPAQSSIYDLDRFLGLLAA